MKALFHLLIVATTISTSSAYAISTQNEAIDVAKHQCRREMPPKGTAVYWGAIPSSKKMWSTWAGYGPGWEVHGRYDPPNKDANDISVIDMIVFVPVHGLPSECDSVSN